MTPEQALTVLKEVFSELTAPHQQLLQPQQQVSSSQAQPLLASFSREIVIQSQQEEAVVKDDFSVISIAQAFCTFRNDADVTQSITLEFFDTVFCFVYEQLVQFPEKNAMALGPQLDIVKRIIHAAHRACAETLIPGYDLGPASNSELGMIFRSISTHLLESVWSLLCEIRQQESEHGFEEGKKSICVLRQVEIVLASLLQSLLVICKEQGGEPHLAGLVDLCYHMARMFAEVIIPMHLVLRCNEDVAHLVSGLLTLFEIFWNLRHVPSSVAAIQIEIVARLLSFHIIERTIQSLQGMSPESTSASTNKRFIGALMLVSGIFCESPLAEDANMATRDGDILPGLDVLATFNLDEMWMYLVARGKYATQQEEQDRLDCQRWAIAFYYLQIRHDRRSSGDYKPLWESIPVLLANEHCLDYLNGTSWCQLVYLYVTLDREIDPTGTKRRPFSYSRIVAGLQQSVHEPDDTFSLAHNALKLHVEEILPWLWKHDGTSTQELVAKVPSDIFVTMMLMLFDKTFKIEKNTSVRERRLLKEDSGADGAKVMRITRLVSQHPLALCSLKAIFCNTCHILEVYPGNADPDPRWRTLFIVCSIIGAFACRLTALEQDNASAEFKLWVCQDVVEAGSKFCASGQATVTELIYVWEMLDVVVPLLKPRKAKEPLVKWDGYEGLDRVMCKLLLQVEQCQTGTIWEGQQQLVLFFRTMWSHIRLISLHLDVHDVGMFHHQRELLHSLWETIQEFMDLLLSPDTSQQLSTTISSTTRRYSHHHHNHHRHHDEPTGWHEVWSCVTDCAVEGMLLLHNMHARFPELITLAVENDRALMVHYCLELVDVFMKGTVASQTPLTDPRELVFALVQWVTTTTKTVALGDRGGSGGGGEEVDMCESDRVDLWSWLDLMLDCLSDSTLHETNDSMVWKTLRVYMEALLSCFHQGSPSSSSSTEAAKTPSFALFIYPTPQADTTHSWIQARLSYQGHKELLTSLWRRWNAAAKAVVEQMQRASMKQQEQDGVNTNTGLDAQALVQLSRVVSDILTLMRMIVHEGPKDDNHYRPLDLEFVDWTTNLIDSKLIAESSEILRELAAVATAPHPDAASASSSSSRDNCFKLSLAELAQVREECASIQARYCYCCRGR
ncbi:MAG: hypothetical protein J3R72DRAFT_524340 [Linnemannia gamsii]|nr:MAG: hypothetical protein J3R72DRAFT_524340 [Linnemannia gamsii]